MNATNVFQFLGIPERTKVVQLVKNFEEVPESKIEFPLYAQVKKDGVYCMVVNTRAKGAKAFGRTGKSLVSCDALAARFEYLPEGVYIGELCFPSKSLEILSGIVNPNRVKDVDPVLLKAFEDCKEFHVHDYICLYEFIQGYSPQSYLHRLDALTSYGVRHLPYHLIHSLADADDFARQCIEAGEEGAVFKQDVNWEAGHKGWRAMKRVRRIEYDLLCVGAEEGKGKYAGKVGNLIFQWKDGTTIKAMLGKDYTHEDAERMWNDYVNSEVGGDCCEFHIFRVYGLQDSSKGKIRLPKVGEMRHDKEQPDF